MIITARKLILLCLVLTLFILCTGCLDNTNDPDVEEPILIDGPVNRSSDLGNSPFVGEFKSTYCALFASLSADVFELQDDIPVLLCHADGTFSLSIVDTVGDRKTYVLSGIFTIAGDIASFTVDGDEEPYFTMRLINENEMRYAGQEFYWVSQGDIFTRTGTN